MRSPGRRGHSLDYAGAAFPVIGLGPGRRVAVWVRGCRRRCAGCMAPELWKVGRRVPVADVAAQLAPLVRQADGLTISGGEPFLQAAALCRLIDLLRAECDVEVLVYTGFLMEELRSLGEDVGGLLTRVDLLIDGPFEQDQSNQLQWRGSDNQRLYACSPRGLRHLAAGDQPMPEPRPLQVQMLGPNRYRIVGIPRRGDLSRYRQAMADQGWEVLHGG